MRVSNRAKAAFTFFGGVTLIAVAGQQGCTRPAEPATQVVSRAAVAKYDWMQFGGNPSHSGNNTLETQISQTTVSTSNSSR